MGEKERKFKNWYTRTLFDNNKIPIRVEIYEPKGDHLLAATPARIGGLGNEDQPIANIMAAGPELLAALEKGIRWNDDGPCWCPLRRKVSAINGRKFHLPHCVAARAALAKARGATVEELFDIPTTGRDRAAIAKGRK